MFRKTIFFVLGAALILTAAVQTIDAAPKIKAMLINGQMKYNHKWQETTPRLVQIMEQTGKIAVDVNTMPPMDQSLKSYRPDFKAYDVIVLNCDPNPWPEQTQQDFENYVKNGGGLVIYHEANNAWPNWEEYNKMIAVGGWNGRNEKHGPMIYWEDGKMKKDNSPGRGGAHGKQREYKIHTRAPQHPIMQGLPDVWMHVKDELYAKLRGPAQNVTILATGVSKLTNRHEPLLMTIAYGQGRVFHTCLGHGPNMLKCVGFITTFQRGTEWAATGKVTIPVPSDFPTAEQTSTRELKISGM